MKGLKPDYDSLLSVQRKIFKLVIFLSSWFPLWMVAAAIMGARKAERQGRLTAPEKRPNHLLFK